ncbi:MAG: TolC family protein [Gammaproteobacteria bacterium]|nr:TolC family protein [Gammaproteobacteria bacterium]
MKIRIRPYLVCAGLAVLVLGPAVHAGELGDLLQTALQHPQARAAASQAEAARAQKDAATGRYFGSAALSAGWHNYEGQRVVGVYTPGTPGSPLVSDRIGQAGLAYSLPVDLFGVIAANRERAQHDLDAAEQLARQQTLLKLHQTASAYLTMQALLKQREALAIYRQRVEATHSRIKKEVELGKAAGVDARYAESELARLVADEAVLNGALIQAQADIEEAGSREKFLPTRADIHVPAWEDATSDATLPARIAQARREAARAQADESRQALLPSLSLDANYFRNIGGGDHRDTWALGGVVSLPLGVSQYRQADAQRLSARAAAEQSEAAARDSARQLANLRAAYDAAAADALAMEKEVAYREQVAKVQREMQRLGSQTLENLFRHERDLFDARFRLEQARARAAASWSAAQVLTGLPTENYIARMDAK